MDADSDPAPPPGAVTPSSDADHAELERLVTGFSPSAPPAVHAANAAIGLADGLARLGLAVVLGAVVLVVLALTITPWLWIAVAVWVLWAALTVVWLLTRRRRRGPRRIEAPPTVRPSDRRGR